MRSFLKTILHSGSTKEHGQRLAVVQLFDGEVERLGYEETLLLARYLMTLARRRRCATNHLGEYATKERALDWRLEGWYYKNGYTDADTAHSKMLDDLGAITEDPAQISEVIRKRVILTDYFSDRGKLEDCYSYGEINPFIFEAEDGIVSLRDTLFDQTDFLSRVSTIISFDPEIRGHKHQIRYFRSLLVAYSLAHILSDRGIESDSITTCLQDEQALANGWLAVAQRMKNFSIRPDELPPDESFLYDQGKVSESAMLFDEYCRLSERVLGLRSWNDF
jgi:hypothetical protein